MSGDEEKQLVTFKAKKQTYEQAKNKLKYGQLSEEMRTALSKIAYGTKTTQREKLREQLETLRSEKQDIENEIDSLRNDRDEKQRKIERVEEQLDAIRDTDSEYNGALEMLESKLYEGERIYPERDDVERAATIGETTKSGVIEDLQDRNPDIPGYAFELSSVHEPTDWRDVE